MITLPKRKIFQTPRLLLADAYTVGSNKFQSDKAKEESVYYVTFRRVLNNIDKTLYDEGDDRIVFVGLQHVLERLFYEPITHEEIDETKRFLSTFKATTKGYTEYEFPEELWRKVVDDYNGRPPIEIKAMPEGSVVYPNEPVIVITSKAVGFGELAAWFESKLLQTWATTERVTQNQHWLTKLKNMVKTVEPYLDDDTVTFLASLMLTDFGDRAGITNQESEELGMVHLYTFSGTDTCCGAYQAWKNADENTVGSSVNALAHRNIQAYEFENDCYTAIYESCKNNEIISMVADCYDYYYAVENYLLPLAKRSIKENNGKIVVSRPDSGIAIEQVIWTCELAEKHGLVEYREIGGITWKFATTLKFIEGDGMTWSEMKDIIDALLEKRFVPYSFGLFGVGGGLRNGLKRDNLSAKYALASKGLDKEPVVKFSDTLTKTTLPGPFKILRTTEALESKKTIIFDHEEGEDSLVVYFDGSNIEKPFGIGQDDNFLVIKDRINKQFNSMPLTLHTSTNHNYPASDTILSKRIQLLEKYAPNKNKDNY